MLPSFYISKMWNSFEFVNEFSENVRFTKPGINLKVWFVSFVAAINTGQIFSWKSKLCLGKFVVISWTEKQKQKGEKCSCWYWINIMFQFFFFFRFWVTHIFHQIFLSSNVKYQAFFLRLRMNCSHYSFFLFWWQIKIVFNSSSYSLYLLPVQWNYLKIWWKKQYYSSSDPDDTR